MFEDVRKAIEATIGNLTPAKAQEIAKNLEPGAAKEQLARTAADLIEWSQRNRERLRAFVRGEIADQMKAMGIATQSELDALKKRVRELERAAGMTASGRSASAKAPAKARSAKARSAKRVTSARSGAKPTTSSRAAPAAT